MKKTLHLTLILLSLFAFNSIACGFSTGNKTEAAEESTPVKTANTPEASRENPATHNTPVHSKPASVNPQSVDSEFPLPDDISNFSKLGEGQINFQVKSNMQDIMDFYRQKFSEQGLKERELLTVTDDTTFSMVFDGAANGQSIVVQGVALSEDTLNINIRYEKV